jgi:uncharacterized protein (DUF983 family)
MKITSLSKVVANAARCRCPECGQTPIFQTFLKVRKQCANCGLEFEPEQGFFIGAIYFNVGVTYFLILALFSICILYYGTVTENALIGMGVIAAIVPVAFFRWSRSFWLAFNFLVLKPRTQLDSRITGIHRD